MNFDRQQTDSMSIIHSSGISFTTQPHSAGPHQGYLLKPSPPPTPHSTIAPSTGFPHSMLESNMDHCQPLQQHHHTASQSSPGPGSIGGPMLHLRQHQKRKSSPAAFGLPCGSVGNVLQSSEENEPQNQHMEAAYSLINFQNVPNGPPEFVGSRSGKDVFGGPTIHQQWGEPLTSPQHHDHNHWGAGSNNLIYNEAEAMRRHSFDCHPNTRMSSPTFYGPSDLPNANNSPLLPYMEPSSTHPHYRSSASSASNGYFEEDVKPAPSPTAGARLTWMQGSPMHEGINSQDITESSIHHPQPNIFTPSNTSLHSIGYNPTSPCTIQPGMQHNRILHLNKHEAMPDHSPEFDGDFGMMTPTPGMQPSQPASPTEGLFPKRAKSIELTNAPPYSMGSPEEGPLDLTAPYPDMGPEDVEAANTDPDAKPRRQRLRYPGDKYTPIWVRYSGQLKEGFCDTCKPGKWLQLKNSAFWYHKQFIHGISSVSGREFVPPVERRWADQDVMEGLCNQCLQWVPISNTKRKNTMLWYRHAHKCHVYHKPKSVSGKKRC
ncbi:hypothetical protein BC938DRAFT_480459 [Jimgerdemannia flammicorona]|uniref:Transcription regulator Rua1 C-terminal domain-containing protein n=1 Tax=Jimgerdemannia flammicorona TaxID=994334 RepID=A0A433QIH9_9FUNG|nr:hypothetical protein BC938DRAFT_480459 [Jimgerdemannia flammicorona]